MHIFYVAIVFSSIIFLDELTLKLKNISETNTKRLPYIINAKT